MTSNHNDVKQQKSSIDLNRIVEPTFAHREAAQQTSSLMTPLLNDYVVIGDTDIPAEPNSDLMKSLEHKFLGNNSLAIHSLNARNLNTHVCRSMPLAL